MSANSLVSKSFGRILLIVVGYLSWVLFSFVLAQIIVSLSVIGINEYAPIGGVSEALSQLMVTMFVYVLTLAIVVGVPWALKHRTTKFELGLTRLPSWLDIGLTPLAFVGYAVLSGVFIALAGEYIPGFDIAQEQDVGFSNLSMRYELILAFVALVVVAPIAEEVLFRGYLYGKLRKYAPTAVAMILTSALFGLIHGQWNVAVDTFILSMVMCGLREITGSIWAGTLLHMLKNGIAFFILFIYPNITLL